MNYNYNGAYAHVGTNQGIKATWEPNGPTGSWWISQTFANQLWAQTGVFNSKWFYYIQDRSTGTDLVTINWAHLKPADYTKPHTFEISQQGGHKGWRFLIDGKSIGSYGIGADGSGDFLLTNEFADAGDKATFHDAQVMVSGVWRPASSAFSFTMGDPVLGIAGHLQDPTLAPGALRIGGPASVTNGTQLW